MIARFRVVLPFTFDVAAERLSPVELRNADYLVSFRPPLKAVVFDSSSGQIVLPYPLNPQGPTPDRTINDLAVIEANLLEIHFIRENFNRSRALKPEAIEPNEAFMFASANDWIQRLRMITEAARCRLLTGMESWVLHYLNDDQTELEPDPHLFRMRLSLHYSASSAAIDEDVLAAADRLPHDYQAPRHRMLLLDAKAMLPEMGSAIVLAATALEVAVELALNELASRSPIPAKLWKWITDRDDFRKEPTVEEQFDILLDVFFGKSLKSDENLWLAFKGLKKARNSFVHTGQLELSGKPLDIMTVNRLLDDAGKILDWLDPALPPSQRRVSLGKIFMLRAVSPAFPVDI